MIHYISYIHNWLYHFLADSIPDTFSYVRSTWVEHFFSLNPQSLWIILQLLIVCLLILLFKVFKNRGYWIIFEYIFEKVYSFFEEILEVSWKQWVKSYVTTLFFIIFISNLSSWFLEFLRLCFQDIEFLNNLVIIPTTSLEFNLWLAIISVSLLLFTQLSRLWCFKTLLEYIPIFGKNIISIEQWNIPSYLYLPIKVIVKIFDIIISLFVGFLDIIGLFAKVISLSARLYGNMISGGILLSILVIWLDSLSDWLFWVNFPFLIPLILFAQSLLVATIQAFVFPLLVSIFIKLADQGQEI